MKRFSFLIIASIFMMSCENKKNAKAMAHKYLEQKNWVADNTIDGQLKEILKGINVMTVHSMNKYFVLEDDYLDSDSSQILIVPFRKLNQTGEISAFSSVENKVVFINPLQIREFVSLNSLIDSTDISGYLGLILLHELSHFILGVSGAFDESAGSSDVSASILGEQDMGTEPVHMTYQKKLELQVDSMAVALVREGMKKTEPDCFSICLNIQLAVNGAEFMLFGKRLIQNFGSLSPGMIQDDSWTHPNLELRMAFMNYYLNPTPEKLSQIDDYIYQREVEPVHRQGTDPRIYQGE